MIFEHYGECPFCKQQVFITSTKPSLTPEEITEEAIDACSCDGARFDRGMKATEAAIRGTVGEDCMQRGMPYIASEQTQEAVRAICGMMIKGFIGGTFKIIIPGGDTVRFVKDGNRVKLCRDTKKRVEI